MIDVQTLGDIQADFYSGPDQEILVIPPEETELFWEWFRRNSDYFNNYYGTPTFNTQGFIAGRCFGNSQTAAFNHQLDYYEGFVQIKGRYYFHAFNLIESYALDITALSNPEHFLDFNEEATSHYIGVSIPFDLIAHNNLADIKAKAVNINCLIYHLFNMREN